MSRRRILFGVLTRWRDTPSASSALCAPVFLTRTRRGLFGNEMSKVVCQQRRFSHELSGENVGTDGCDERTQRAPFLLICVNAFCVYGRQEFITFPDNYIRTIQPRDVELIEELCLHGFGVCRVRVEPAQ
jgi:hypothetical protein